jgi:hypothetical protein
MREVAERSGVSARFLVQLESGVGNISVRRLGDVAAALDTTPAALLTDRRTGAVDHRAAGPARCRARPPSAAGSRSAAACRSSNWTAGSRGGGTQPHRDLRAARRGLLPPPRARNLQEVLTEGRPIVLATGGGIVDVAGNLRAAPPLGYDRLAAHAPRGSLEPRRPPGRPAPDGRSPAGDGRPAQPARRARAAVCAGRPRRGHDGPIGGGRRTAHRAPRDGRRLVGRNAGIKRRRPASVAGAGPT